MNPESKTPEWHEMSLFVVNGTVVHFSLSEMRFFILSRHYALVLILFSLFCSVVNPVVAALHAPLIYRFPVWLLCLSFGTFIWIVTAFALNGLRQWAGIKYPLPSPLLQAISTLGSIVSVVSVLSYVLNLPEMMQVLTFGFILRYIFIALVFEFVIVTVVAPAFERRTGRTHGDSGQPKPEIIVPDDPGCTRIQINQNSYDKTDIYYLKSAEHYVELVSSDHIGLERANLRDLIELFTDQDGIQPHRSFWVARQAVNRLSRNNSKWVLLLNNGDEIPVSRGRQKKVRIWLNEKSPGI